MADKIWKWIEYLLPWLIKNPSGALAAFLVIDLVYFGMRSVHDDPLLHVFKDTSDISGEWEYFCSRTGTLRFEHGGVEHGGVVTIFQRNTSNGIQISIIGKRKWKKDLLSDGTLKHSNLDDITPWQSQALSFTGPNSIVFLYNTLGKEALSGYVQANLMSGSDGKVNEIEGTFVYQLPNEKLMWGRVKFRKMKSGTDLNYKEKDNRES